MEKATQNSNTKAKEGKIQDDTPDLMEKRRKLKQDSQGINSIEYTELSKTINKKIIEDVRKFNVQRVKQAIENNKGIGKAYREIKIGKTHVTAIKDKNGNIATNSEKILEVIAEFYQTLCKNDAATNNINPSHDMESILEIKEDEIQNAIKKMKQEKAPGPDGITLELIIEGGEIILQHLRTVFTQCLKLGGVPKSWKHGQIILIHKKGDKEDIRNHRPTISLLSTTYKIFTNIL